ncbi:MAG: hypothetical protein Q9188_005498 [Gyalolechia gomerana]
METSNDGLGAVKTLLQSRSSGGIAKQVALTFRHLNVTAPDSGTVYAKTLPKAIMNTFGVDQFSFLRNHLFSKRSLYSAQSSTREILTDFTGIVKPGEMLFVLGRPGSGCSTFLRTAANRSKLGVTGDLSFANITASEFEKHHRRETIYLPEEDRHTAALSVSQRIRFALRMSLPSEIRTNQLVEELVRGLGEDVRYSACAGHACRRTILPRSVGRRAETVNKTDFLYVCFLLYCLLIAQSVSIAEVLAAGSSVQCFDNSTRGLNSSIALDFVKALRRLTDIGRKTTLATLYQAGENIYSHFDKVLLIDQGYQIYFGRTEEAKTYLEDLGFVPLAGSTTAEFLTH